jgi:hypothetical protein
MFHSMGGCIKRKQRSNQFTVMVNGEARHESRANCSLLSWVNEVLLTRFFRIVFRNGFRV